MPKKKNAPKPAASAAGRTRKPPKPAPATPKAPHEGRNLTPPVDPPKPAETAPQAATAPKAPPAAPDKTPPRLTWTFNGPRWEAPSLKVAGRTYTATHNDEKGWTGGYNGQKGGCPAAGVFHPLASYARATVQAVEDAID